MIKEKIYLSPQFRNCVACGKKVKSGELIYLVEGGTFLCEKCGKENRQIREKREYAVIRRVTTNKRYDTPIS